MSLYIVYSIIYKLSKYYIKHSFFFLTICWQPSIVIKSIINYKYVVKTIENYMEELKKKKKKTNKQTNITFGKILLHFTHQRKKKH